MFIHAVTYIIPYQSIVTTAGNFLGTGNRYNLRGSKVEINGNHYMMVACSILVKGIKRQ